MILFSWHQLNFPGLPLAASRFFQDFSRPWKDVRRPWEKMIWTLRFCSGFVCPDFGSFWKVLEDLGVRNLHEWNIHTVDGSEIRQTHQLRLGWSLADIPLFTTGFKNIQTVVVWDFWTINSRVPSSSSSLSLSIYIYLWNGLFTYIGQLPCGLRNTLKSGMMIQVNYWHR